MTIFSRASSTEGYAWYWISCILFFTACELMDLPFDNPFAFFVKLDDILHHPDKFRLDGKPADLNEHRFLPMGVLLLYACYSNDLFALSDAAHDAHFSTLWQQLSLQYIEEELDRLGIKQTICRLVARTERRDIYRLYPELVQFNKSNTYFSLRNGTLPLQHVKHKCRGEMPDFFSLRTCITCFSPITKRNMAKHALFPRRRNSRRRHSK